MPVRQKTRPIPVAPQRAGDPGEDQAHSQDVFRVKEECEALRELPAGVISRASSSQPRRPDQRRTTAMTSAMSIGQVRELSRTVGKIADELTDQ